MYLHLKAQKDLLAVLNKFVTQGNQVIYATHSPSLIDTDVLGSINLVLNNNKQGTIVEKITTAKIDKRNMYDALQPVLASMGYACNDFALGQKLQQNNVLLEGISDFWYLKAMQKLLSVEVKQNYEFVPCIGIKGVKIFPTISFCIGYGLSWLLIMDNGPHAIETKDNLRIALFNNESINDDINKHVELLPEAEIENMFNNTDIINCFQDYQLHNKGSKPIDMIGVKRKELFAHSFYKKVYAGEIDKSNLSDETIQKFKEIFNWIDKSFKKNNL